jgi:hypothetical protein
MSGKKLHLLINIMSNLHEPVKILPKGWERIEFSSFYLQNIEHNPPVLSVPQVPSDKLLEELIRIPQHVELNPFYLGKYRERFLPQKYDYGSQKLLREYSNSFVRLLNSRRANGKNASLEYIFLKDFCAKRCWDYDPIEYTLLVRDYCTNLLPVFISNLKKDNSSNKYLMSLIEACKTPEDFKEAISGNPENQGDKHSPEREYFEKKRKSLTYAWTRFSDFRAAVTHFYSIQHQVLLYGEIATYNLALLEDNKLTNSGIRKNRDKNGTPYRLNQCLFCYKFTTPTKPERARSNNARPANYSRTCGDRACQTADDAWKGCLDRNGLLPKDYGFF